MVQQTERGRYARMLAFWSLFLLFGYGVLGEFVIFVKVTVFGDWLKMEAAPWTSLPLLGEFGWPMLIAVSLQAFIGIMLHRWLSRPKIANALIATEDEMRKVTWPSWSETWVGTLAVIITVSVLLGYLYLADRLYINLFRWVLGGS